ncbi:hypothetical protein ASPWEDRAFT_118302 [Aspergillus wentii DTO 134E9]|uniref:Terpene cyclase/mutase family member n=1 Tax=Aspergillus wentii DTO 134E9 TaxID=1073089 RepID=A0A1L9R826_ASPWE|nr:uncharacterized protein ASPWEDRAFT_118302 [Aspergillus wentii DTO 134E9]OJJ31027.1 hypothetical protein ASPWEDRAFT_118302 [Aspergillus wentii DTO 134E9]
MREFALKIKDSVDPEAVAERSYQDPSSYWPFSSRRTELEGWRLAPEEGFGRLKWNYLPTEQEREAYPQDTPSRFFLERPMLTPEFGAAKKPSETVFNAARFHSNVQISQLGCWAADMSCVFFVTPMLIITWYLTGAVIPEAQAIELVNYILASQNEDGGWPTYLREKTALMGTIMIYVALRLIGLPAENEHLVKARGCLLQMGGAAYLPCWAKFWLAMLGLYEWEGTDPYPAEIWLLPEWLPISPWKWYCFPRQVYMAMSFLAARKFTIPSNPLLDQIRAEIYVESYSSLNFASLRGMVLQNDRHQPKSWALNALNWAVANIWTPFFRTQALAQRAEEKVWELIYLCDKANNSTGGGCVDQYLFMLAFYCKWGPDSKDLKRIQQNSFEYLWMSPKGMQSMSIHGGHAWETSFVLQSLVESGVSETPELKETTQRAYKYLVDQQYLEDWADSPPCYRFSRLGGWPFTAKYSGMACSDCTGEAFKAILLLEKHTNLPRLTTDQSHRLAVDNLLLVQNTTGGYSTFEPTRTTPLLERLNGTELFGKVMVEYDFTECTSSAITALALFQSQDPSYRADEVKRAITRGLQYIHQEQRADGGWLAGWGVGFTYGTMFALEALEMAGKNYSNHFAAKKACEFLLDKQKPDGGWGETVDSILKETYTQSDDTHTVQTAWGCIALMNASYPDPEPIKKGIRLIMSRQKPNGEWPQERPVGSGIVTCELLYHNYVYSFGIRAVNMYRQRYGDEALLG